jgi:hypothetical protein
LSRAPAPCVLFAVGLVAALRERKRKLRQR